MYHNQMDSILNQYESDQEGYDQIDSDDVDSDYEGISRFIIESHKCAPIGVVMQEGQQNARQMKVENPSTALRFYKSNGKK
jgi:hypothetical protein